MNTEKNKDFIDILVETIDNEKVSYRPMFTENALCYDHKVIGLVCNNTFYLKITPSNEPIFADNTKGKAYNSAIDSWIVNATQLADKEFLNQALLNVYKDLLENKKRGY